MNTSPNPPAAFGSSSRDNPCYDIDSTVAALNVAADDGRSYLLPYAQFLHAERTANPALETEPDAPPEKLLLHFATADVELLGIGFKAVENVVHVHDLHATILHLLGFNHEQFTFRYAGRDFRLTDVYGHVVKNILA